MSSDESDSVTYRKMLLSTEFVVPASIATGIVLMLTEYAAYGPLVVLAATMYTLFHIGPRRF